jgi:hypothetical protein
MSAQIVQTADPISVIIGFILTILILSYIIGDNILFRVAVHLFIGVASGYAAVLILYNVIWHQAVVPVLQVFTENKPLNWSAFAIQIIPALLLSIWMLTKLSPRLARGGTPVLAFLTGVGAATVIGGAVLGTLFPQVGASANVLNIHAAPPALNNMVGWFINALIILVGTVTTLIFFQFGMRRQEEGESAQQPLFMEYLSTVGQGFLVVTLGVLFAGVYLATLAALIDRIRFLWEAILRFI